MDAGAESLIDEMPLLDHKLLFFNNLCISGVWGHIGLANSKTVLDRRRIEAIFSFGSVARSDRVLPSRMFVIRAEKSVSNEWHRGRRDQQ